MIRVSTLRYLDQGTGTGPTSPSTDPVVPTVKEGSLRIKLIIII